MSGTGCVRYCRTANHRIVTLSGSTPSMGVATGTAVVPTTVDLPSDLDIGAGHLEVIANGIPSAPVRVQIRDRVDG